MEKFVLTVLRDNVLDACEVFEDQSSALNSGIYFCEMTNIEVNRYPNYDEKMRGWLVSDSHGYFVSVVRRPIHLTTYMVGSSYGAFLDALAGRGGFGKFGNFDYADPMKPLFVPGGDLSGSTKSQTVVTYGRCVGCCNENCGNLKPACTCICHTPVLRLTGLPEPTKPVAVVPLPPPPPYSVGDDPSDRDLPGGFSFTDSKPMTMEEVYRLPNSARDVSSLDENQKWALVLARTKHRPKQVMVIPGLGCWSQHYMLQELTKRTSLGIRMRQIELLEIQAMYDEAAENYYGEDESSSSSEEEDYD